MLGGDGAKENQEVSATTEQQHRAVGGAGSYEGDE